MSNPDNNSIITTIHCEQSSDCQINIAKIIVCYTYEPQHTINVSNYQCGSKQICIIIPCDYHLLCKNAIPSANNDENTQYHVKLLISVYGNGYTSKMQTPQIIPTAMKHSKEQIQLKRQSQATTIVIDEGVINQTNKV